MAGYKSNIENNCTETNNLKSIPKRKLDKLIFAHLNISSIINNFEFLAKDLASNVEILMISETEIDNCLPKGQFSLKGFF